MNEWWRWHIERSDDVEGSCPDAVLFEIRTIIWQLLVSLPVGSLVLLTLLTEPTARRCSDAVPVEWAPCISRVQYHVAHVHFDVHDVSTVVCTSPSHLTGFLFVHCLLSIVHWRAVFIKFIVVLMPRVWQQGSAFLFVLFYISGDIYGTRSGMWKLRNASRKRLACLTGAGFHRDVILMLFTCTGIWRYFKIFSKDRKPVS